MTKIDSSLCGKTVSFEVYPATMPDNFKNCKVMSILDGATCKELGQDIEAMHRNFYGSIPNPPVDDPYGYLYLKVILVNGGFSYVGIPWIRAETMKVIGALTLRATITNVTADDATGVMEALSANGYTNVKVELIEAV